MPHPFAVFAMACDAAINPEIEDPDEDPNLDPSGAMVALLWNHDPFDTLLLSVVTVLTGEAVTVEVGGIGAPPENRNMFSAVSRRGQLYTVEPYAAGPYDRVARRSLSNPGTVLASFHLTHAEDAAVRTEMTGLAIDDFGQRLWVFWQETFDPFTEEGGGPWPYYKSFYLELNPSTLLPVGDGEPNELNFGFATDPELELQGHVIAAPGGLWTGGNVCFDHYEGTTPVFAAIGYDPSLFEAEGLTGDYSLFLFRIDPPEGEWMESLYLERFFHRVFRTRTPGSFLLYDDGTDGVDGDITSTPFFTGSF